MSPDYFEVTLEWPMPSERDLHEPSTVELLKEAFESGRSVTLHISDREAPLTGCVSHIYEGRVAGDYVFSAFVGEERVVVAAGGIAR
jgi:hypothetical protein